MKTAVFVLLSGLVLLVSGCARGKEVETREPVTVKVQRIEYSRESRQQVYIGRVEAGKTSLVSTSYPGCLVKLYVRKGQRVEKGRIMAVVDSPAVTSLYETSKATYEQAKDALDRVNQVYSTGSVTELKLVEVQTSYAKAESAYKAAKRALANCKIKAPFDGIVGDILVQEGVELVANEPVFRYLDIRSVQIHASVPENEYALYSVGQKAQVYVDAVDATREAELVDKGYEASALSHSYDFLFRIKGYPGKMMPGMVCKVYLKSSSSRSVVIPSSAVRDDSEGRYVWCVGQEGAVEKKHITVSGFAGEGIVVEDGLSEGDLLVIDGGRKISTGMTNIVVDESR